MYNKRNIFFKYENGQLSIFDLKFQTTKISLYAEYQPK